MKKQYCNIGITDTYTGPAATLRRIRNASGPNSIVGLRENKNISQTFPKRSNGNPTIPTNLKDKKY